MNSQDQRDEYFLDVQIPEPVARVTALFTRVATGAALVYFSVLELVKELKDYQKTKELHG